MTHDELVEKVARDAVQLPLSRMFGGCINPTDETRGECADGGCWCVRVSRHIAEDALSIALGEAVKVAVKAGEMPPTILREQDIGWHNCARAIVADIEALMRKG